MIVISDFTWAINKALEGHHVTYDGITDNHGYLVKYDDIRMFFKPASWGNETLLHLSAKTKGMYTSDVNLNVADVNAKNWKVVENGGTEFEIR